MVIVLDTKRPGSESEFLMWVRTWDARISYAHNTVRHRQCKFNKQMVNGRTCYALIQIECSKSLRSIVKVHQNNWEVRIYGKHMPPCVTCKNVLR